jgi:anaerobic magnesium-protoporphyrin IX monomethyl ester cyclase
LKVLLLNLMRPPAALGGRFAAAWAPMPPITLAYLAAVVERAGFDVAVFEDGAGSTRHELRDALRRERPDVVGLSLITALMPDLEGIVATIRADAPGARIVAGNIHASIYDEELLRAGRVDLVVQGEGEDTFVALLEELSSRHERPALHEIAGISFLDGDEVVRTRPRPVIEDLDRLPFPAWHLFPMERYRLLSFARHRDPGFLLLGSRGCPYGCTYCSLKIMGKRRRARSVGNIADEAEMMLDRFGWVQPSFVDPIFPFSRREGLDYANELIRRGLHQKQVWITETRVDLVDYELLVALKESGLRRIMFGIEAGDADDLVSIGKTSGVDRAVQAVQAARKAGLVVIGFFMLGVPGSTRENMERTITYATKLGLDFAKFNVFVPYPGTPIHGTLEAEGSLSEPTNWARYTSYPTRSNLPVYSPEGVSPRELADIQTQAHTRFYLRPSVALRQLFVIRSLKMREIAAGLSAIGQANVERAGNRILSRLRH